MRIIIETDNGKTLVLNEFIENGATPDEFIENGATPDENVSAKPCHRLSYELRTLINQAVSDTPDYILAEYMLDCLIAFENATIARRNWHRNKE